MECAHFGICGGCNNTALSYKQQFEGKIAQTTQEFYPLLNKQNVRIESFDSLESGFRARAEWRIYHDNGTMHFAMSALESAHKVPITQCPILLPILQSLFPLLLDILQHNQILHHKLYACNLLCSMQDEVIITLIYHKHLDSLWEEAAQKAQYRLTKALNVPLHIVGRSKNQKCVLGKTYICESLSLLNGTYHYQYFKQEGAFSQPNPLINLKMLEFVASSLQKLYPKPICDALEIYCGSGNFTLILSAFFRKVLATEVVKSAIALLKDNMTQNHITNITPVRLNARESIQALCGERAFFRLKDVDIASFNIECVLIDPPRSGVGDKAILAFLQRFPSIIYISCNPSTLTQYLSILLQTHSIARFGLFDQFPYTHHRECVVILRKNLL